MSRGDPILPHPMTPSDLTPLDRSACAHGNPPKLFGDTQSGRTRRTTWQNTSTLLADEMRSDAYRVIFADQMGLISSAWFQQHGDLAVRSSRCRAMPDVRAPG
jgi:hypothetical protein